MTCITPGMEAMTKIRYKDKGALCRLAVSDEGIVTGTIL